MDVYGLLCIAQISITLIECSASNVMEAKTVRSILQASIP